MKGCPREIALLQDASRYLAVVNAGYCDLQGLHNDYQTKDTTLMTSVMDSFMARLLAGSPDTLDFPSSWWDNSPQSATSDICQRLTDAGYLIIPAFEDSVYFIALSALQRHFVSCFQRGQPQAATGATSLEANQGNLRSTQPCNTSAFPQSTAAASTPEQPPKAPCCKDCTMAHLASMALLWSQINAHSSLGTTKLLRLCEPS